MRLLLFAVGYMPAATIPQNLKTKRIYWHPTLDSTIKPGDDFFMYANGGWIKKNPIPGSESGWGIGNLVNEENYIRKKKINEDAAAAKAAEGTMTQKIGDFWTSAMDSVAIDKAGLTPLQPDFNKITAAQRC